MSIKNRILFIFSQCVDKQSQDFACQSERLFPTQLTWQGSVNMVKVLWCRFQKGWARLPWCFSKGPLKRKFLGISLTTFSNSVILKIQSLWGSSSSSKYLKFHVDFKNAAKNCEKVFSFPDNCIWIGIVKLSLLRTGYLPLAANVLRSSTKIWHVNKREFFNVNFFGSDQWIW